MSSLEYGYGPLDVRRQRVQGLLDDQLHPYGRGQVDDDIRAPDGLVHRQLVKYRPLHEAETGVVPDSVQVGETARRQRVEDGDLVAVCQQGFNQVGPDEARSARYEVARHPKEATPPATGN